MRDTLIAARSSDLFQVDMLAGRHKGTLAGTETEIAQTTIRAWERRGWVEFVHRAHSTESGWKRSIYRVTEWAHAALEE